MHAGFGRSVIHVGAAVLGAAVVLALVAGCGGKSDSAAKLRQVTDSLQGPLTRLSDAVGGATPSSRSSIVTLRATAQNAQQAIQTARGDLQDIAGSADQARVQQVTGLLNNLQSLSEALAADPLSVSQLEVVGERARQALQDTATTLPQIDVSRLVSGLRRAKGSQRAQTQNGVSAPVGGGSAASGSPPASVSYADYSGSAFNARLPTGGGWAPPSQSEPTPGRLFRTNLRGPNGLFAIIDYTPFEPAVFGSGRYQSRTDVGQTAFGLATKYVFQGGRLPECQRSTCIDYIVNDRSTGAGFGILAGGGDYATAASVAQTIAESVTPSGG